MSLGTSPRSRQRGVGLVEVSFALVIGIVLASAAVVGAKKSKDRAQTVDLMSEEQLIFKAADGHFRSRCRSGVLPTSVTTASLLSDGFLPRAARSPWGASWNVTYLNSPRRAQVTATLSAAPSELVPWIADYAGAYTVSGSSISWVHNIRIASDTTSANAMEFMAMYETSSC
jgi:hypothetical protein